jgi:hypothetical protein
MAAFTSKKPGHCEKHPSVELLYNDFDAIYYCPRCHDLNVRAPWWQRFTSIKDAHKWSFKLLMDRWDRKAGK